MIQSIFIYLFIKIRSKPPPPLYPMIGKGRSIIYEPIKSDKKKSKKKKGKSHIFEYVVDKIAEKQFLSDPYTYRFPRLK